MKFEKKVLFVIPKGWACAGLAKILWAVANRIAESVNNRTYMFYCGNHYGCGGMGWAELVR